VLALKKNSVQPRGTLLLANRSYLSLCVSSYLIGRLQDTAFGLVNTFSSKSSSKYKI
jgi:hypothetical protein